MCGIAGIIELRVTSNKLKVDKEVIKKMADTIAHRGPDDEGFFVDDNIALGHRRLSILDLSPAGHQPMFYGNFVIVFNGEIYNYLEIRQELIAKGYIFKSETDTEVILAAYKEWGPKCLDRFNGMWAFVIYDRKKKTVFGARDRLGVKPFYYYLDKEKFLFGSEIKAILAHPDIQARPNDKIVWDYLTQNGLVDHTEATMFQDIQELRGGYCFTLKNNQLKLKQYWNLKQGPKIQMTDAQYQAEFRRLFLDSVKLRLRSDVPVGSCLSGGLDSSAIVCAVNGFLKKEKLNQVGKWQKTFSAVYDAKKYQGCDESPYIREVIRKTHAHGAYVYPSGAKLAQEIQKLIWHQDTPFGSTSLYAQWNVFRLASQKKVKVMMDGQGSDEFLAGYLFYREIFLLEQLRRGKIIGFIQNIWTYDFKANRFALRDFVNSLLSRGILGKNMAERYKKRRLEYQMLNSKWLVKYHHNYSLKPTSDIFQNTLYTSAKIGLCSLLRYEERNSMAFSIESRVPFLDYRLVEYLYALPHSQKIHLGQTKWVMREALKGILPEKIRQRKDKIGFATPEEKWIKENLASEFRQVFASESFRSRSYFDADKVKQTFEDFLSGKISDYRFFWRLYNLEIWLRTFVDGEKL